VASTHPTTQFGEAVALYFAFLATYTHSLISISLVGLVAYYFGYSYSIIFSSLLFLWSIIFVEYWRIQERLYAVSWGCLGSVRVENHRPDYTEGQRWWKRELKILSSVPVIAIFATLLALLLTAIFIIEEFVTTLYTGPGHEYVVRQSTCIFISWLYLTLLLSVFCPDDHFRRNHPSLPRYLSGTCTKSNSMGEPQTSVVFRFLSYHQIICPRLCRSIPQHSTYRLSLRSFWRGCHGHCATVRH
jgi:hypothetical protein